MLAETKSVSWVPIADLLAPAMTGMTRGRFAAFGAATTLSLNIVQAPARAAEFSFKCGSNLPVDHPAAVR